MPSRLLTARFVKTVKPPAEGQRDYFDTKERGLVLRISASGKKVWCYVYRMPGTTKLRRLTIDKPLKLAEARKEVVSLRAKTKVEQVDPGAELLAWKAVDTFEELAKWYEEQTATKKSHAEEHRILHNELLPYWKTRKISEITRGDIRAVLNRIAARPAPVMANRVLASSAGSTTSRWSRMSRASTRTRLLASRGRERKPHGTGR